MATKPLNILIIVGTTRQGRTGRAIAEWYMRQAQSADQTITFKLFDLADHQIPVFNESTSPRMGQYGSLQTKLAADIAKADGFVFVTGEYNHSVPGSLKNFLDYLHREWNHKAAAYVGYGVHGGVRAIEHLVQIMAILGVASVRGHITVNAPWAALDESGAVKPELVQGDIAAQVTELNWWGKALRAARQQD